MENEENHIEEIEEEETSEGEEKEESPTASRNEILAAISAALADGTISSDDARHARAHLGISQAYFTRKVPSRSYRKMRRKMQRDSRRQNRTTCKRGQKQTGRV